MKVNIDNLLYKGITLLNEEFCFDVKDVLAILFYVGNPNNDKNKQMIALYLLSCHAPQVRQDDITRLSKIISADMTKDQIKQHVRFLQDIFSLLKSDLVGSK